MNNSTYNSLGFNSYPSVAAGSKSLAFADCNASISVSDYKWLTPSLKTTQQGTAVQPAFSCKVLDDSLISNAIIGTYNLSNSQVRIAPDGKTYVVANYATGNKLGLWILSSAASISKLSSAPDTIIANSWQTNSSPSLNISDWILGSYVIDVAYIDSGSNNVVFERSYDAGLTFVNITTEPLIFPATGQNLGLSVCRPTLNTSNMVDGMVFVSCLADDGSISYQNEDIYYIFFDGSSATSLIRKRVSSHDWIIHSIAAERIGDKYYIFWSGYHQQLENVNNVYSIYATTLIERHSDSTSDYWSEDREFLTSLSASASNLVSYKYPNINISDDVVYLTVNTTSIVSIDENQTVTTESRTLLLTSSDALYFSYPTMIIYSDGTEFSRFTAFDDKVLFAADSSYYYVFGSGRVWQYIKKNIVANLTDDILKYSVSETANAISSISLNVGNANNQWVGSSPTKTNAEALAKNKKILLEQGYVSGGVAALVPKNTFFIDDISQVVASNKNELAITGRDLFKNFRVLKSKYQFNYFSPDYVYDSFDGSTINNWSQLSGSWSEDSSGRYLYLSSAPDTVGNPVEEYNLVYNKPLIRKSECRFFFTTTFQWPISTPADYNRAEKFFFYIYYKDSLNFVRVNVWSYQWDGINAAKYQWEIEAVVNGSMSQYVSSGLHSITDASNNAPFWIEINNYRTIRVTNRLDGFADPLDPRMLQYSTDYLALTLDDTFEIEQSTFGFGCAKYSPKIRNFAFAQFENSNSISDMSYDICNKAGVSELNLQKNIKEHFYSSYNWSGTHALENRIMKIATGNNVEYNAVQSDAEIEFDAKADRTAAGDYDFNIYIRDQVQNDMTNSYQLTIGEVSGTIDVSLFINNTSFSVPYGGTQFLLYRSMYNGGPTIGADLTEWHRYKVSFDKGWFSLYIDNKLVFSFNDIAYYSRGFTSGYFGFKAVSNCTLNIKNMSAGAFWNQIDRASINPGDDFESTLRNIYDTVKGYTFSDNMGRFSAKKLLSTESSNYSYEEQITQQNYVNSDVQYVNQITVIGSGVSYVMRDSESIGTNNVIREAVVVDYKITTLKEAIDRATYELTDKNRFLNQTGPIQLNNVGSELLDVVHITNADLNLNDDFRVYSQTTTLDGQSNAYTIS